MVFKPASSSARLTLIRRESSEPRVALCGFDNPKSRQILEGAGFELIVDVGLGASLDHFDRVVMRTFPDASQKPHEIWTKVPGEIPPVDVSLFEEPEGECGIVLQEIAGKAISSSFTGACASSLAIAEVVRATHGANDVSSSHYNFAIWSCPGTHIDTKTTSCALLVMVQCRYAPSKFVSRGQRNQQQTSPFGSKRRKQFPAIASLAMDDRQQRVSANFASMCGFILCSSCSE